jgi:hypothetical protein
VQIILTKLIIKLSCVNCTYKREMYVFSYLIVNFGHFDRVYVDAMEQKNVTNIY